MRSFTIRIELLGSPFQAVYTDLQAQMQRGGFRQTFEASVVPGQTGFPPFPHTTYHAFAHGTISEVREWAQANVSKVWSRALVYVTHSPIQ